MTPAPRVSPVRFDADARESEDREGWTVVLAYGDEEDGPWLVDLSHRRRWDYQDGDLDERRPFGLEVPPEPRHVAIQGDLVLNRMNRTQAQVWHLGPGEAPDTSEEVAFTEITDGGCMLAVVGGQAAWVMEHVSGLDLLEPGRRFPFLTQGPVLHIPAQVVSFGPDCMVMTLSRGYGQAFAEAMLRSARPAGLRPGGEGRFTRWLAEHCLRPKG